MSLYGLKDKDISVGSNTGLTKMSLGTLDRCWEFMQHLRCFHLPATRWNNRREVKVFVNANAYADGSASMAVDGHFPEWRVTGAPRKAAEHALGFYIRILMQF